MSATNTQDLNTIPMNVTADWAEKIQWNLGRKFKLPNDFNTTLTLTSNPLWRGRLRFNEFSNRAELDGRVITDDDVAKVTLGMQMTANLQVKKGTVLDAMTYVARRNAYHPIREMLRGLRHDGAKRLDTWLTECVGAEDTDLHRAYGRKWLLAAVARVMEPGCKMDTMLILEGPQGIGKSRLYAILCGNSEWFLDQPGEPGSKEAKELQQGKWIIEYAEMDKMRGADVNRIKGYISNTKDSYRKAYGLVSEDFPRQCVFGGSVNPGGTGYLQDETGGRRFWPVTCGDGMIDIEWLKANRDQLLAEAVAAYDAGESWHLEGAELIALQKESIAERYETDAWQAPIEAFLANKVEARIFETTSGEIARGAIGMEAKDVNVTHTRRIGKVMVVLGWESKSIRRDGAKSKTVRCYVLPEAARAAPETNEEHAAALAKLMANEEEEAEDG
jgi:putative DNA primase/helicase